MACKRSEVPCLLGSTALSRVCCAPCVSEPLTRDHGPMAKLQVSRPMRWWAVPPSQGGSAGRIRSGLQPNTSTTRPLTWTNEGQGPCCVSGGARPGPAVGEHLRPYSCPRPCRRWRAHHCADLRFPSSPSTVRAEVPCRYPRPMLIKARLVASGIGDRDAASFVQRWFWLVGACGWKLGPGAPVQGPGQPF